MKNILKCCETFILSGVLATSLVSHADSIQNPSANPTGEFPVLAPKGKCPQVHMPDGYTAPIHFSNSCQTVYVLPSEAIPVTQVAVTPVAGADDSFCNLWDQSKSTISSAQAAMSSLQTQLAKDPANVQNITNAINVLAKQVSDEANRWKYLSALRVSVTVATDQAAQINAFVAKNQDDPSTKDVRFVPMPLYSSILAVGGAGEALGSAPNLACVGQVCLGAIAQVDFPDAVSVSTVDGGTYSPDQYHIVMDGSAQGTFDVNVPTYCELNKRYKGQQVTAQQLFQLFPMKLTMQYPVQAGTSFQMSTSFDLKSMLQTLGSVTNTRFSRDAFYASILNGDMGAAVKVSIDNGPIPKQTSSLNEVLKPGTSSNPSIYGAIGTLTNQLISDFMDSLMSSLKTAKVVTTDNDASQPITEVPATSTNDLVGSQTVCSHNNGFFGIGGSTSCHSEGVYVTVYHDGVSAMENNVSANFNAGLTLNIQETDTTELTATSTFIIGK